MKDDQNRQWRVARFPEPGELIGREHFLWTKDTIPEPAKNEFLVRTICLAPGPAQRGYLEKSHGDFLETLKIGDLMRGRGVGQIISSRHADYREGDIFVGSLGWQDYSIQRPRGAEFVYSSKKVTEPIRPLSMELSILGQAGSTAYFGLLEVGEMKAGDSVLISAAAGGIGSTAGQIARIRRASFVVGIAGSEDKCNWLIRDLGYDAAINYRDEDVRERIRELFPKGIDVFFDNVGGEVLNAALDNLAMHARVVICGFISTDYSPGPHSGPTNYQRIVYKRARMQGFVIFDYWDRWSEAERELVNWYHDGRLKRCEDISDGLETMPDALACLFTGGNRGVKICRVAPDPVEMLGELPSA